MKIITWNCNGAFRKKFHLLEKFNADILVIQECENPELTKDSNYKNFAFNHIWIGDNKNKGLGVFAKVNINIKRLDWTDIYETHQVKYFLPIIINNTQKLLAIWNHQNNSPTFEYIGQLWKYLELNGKFINDTILIGDFNSNSKWDCWDRWWNHTDVVNSLKKNKIESLFHYKNQENQGKESINTFYLQKNINKGYHIDYCFIPQNKLENVKLEIEKFDKWKEFSDHIPLIIEF